MKKLSAIILSMITCLLLAVPLFGNALAIMVDETKYEEWYELEEYIEYTKGKIYRPADNQSSTFLISSTTSRDTGEQIGFGPFVINLNTYILSQEEYLTFSEYMSQNYADIEITSNGNTYSNGLRLGYDLNYNTDLTIDEKLEIAVNIKDSTGFICEHLWLMSEIEATVIEETTTTTTTSTTTETTTTTTTTTAAQTSADAPKTGDSGLAGVLLAGAGAAAMAFVMRKRKND